MKHLGTTSFFLLALAACAPPTTSSSSSSSSSSTLVALPAGFADAVLSRRCDQPIDELAAFNPGLDRDAWLARSGGDLTAASVHVVLDDDAIAACRAVLDDVDAACADVEAVCLPLARFFVGTLDTDEPCAASAECRSGVCRLPWGSDCGVCGDCASNDDCAVDEVCSDNRCTAIKADGEACAAHGECTGTSLCILGVCNQRGDVGAACSGTHDECDDGLFCDDGACAERPAPGEACTDLCAEGDCVDGVCAIAPENCVDDDGCFGATRCDAGLCVPTQQGDACRVDDFERCGDTLYCRHGVCVPNHAVGDRCLTGPDEQAGCGVDAGCFIMETGGAPRCLPYDGRAGVGERCEALICEAGATCALNLDGEEHCVVVDTFHRGEGERCRRDLVLPTCGWPLVCGDDDVCGRPGRAARGEACDATTRCDNELLDTWCVDGVCVARPDVGEPCDPWSHDGRGFANVCTDGARCSDRSFVCEAAVADVDDDLAICR